MADITTTFFKLFLEKLEFDSTPDADHTANGIIIPATVDVNTNGLFNAMHLDSDGNWIDAHADAAVDMPCKALALESGTGAGKKLLLWGFARDETWTWTVGGPIYVSDTSTGSLTQTRPDTSGDQVQVVGYALTAKIIFFCPDNTIVEIT